MLSCLNSFKDISCFIDTCFLDWLTYSELKDYNHNPSTLNEVHNNFRALTICHDGLPSGLSVSSLRARLIVVVVVVGHLFS